MARREDIKIGDTVRFGRARGEKTLGRVVKINRKTVKVEQLESRGARRNYSAGQVWRVPFSLIEKVEPEVETVSPADPKSGKIDVSKMTEGELHSLQADIEAELESRREKRWEEDCECAAVNHQDCLCAMDEMLDKLVEGI